MEIHMLFLPLATEVATMVKDLGYVNKGMQFYYKTPNSNLDNGLKPLNYDKDVIDMYAHQERFQLDKAKGERKSLALKAKKESSDEECLTSESEDEAYAIVSSASYIVSTGRRIIINYLKEQTLCKLKMAEQDIPPPTITAMKIPIIRKGEYDIWSMRMRKYICYTGHNLWDVIVNGDQEEEPAPTTGETSAPPAPKTAKQLAARRNKEKVKSILLLAIPDDLVNSIRII
ncbi:hypothetical protein Tco_0722422 [Tanacetum coccineum]